MIDAASGRLDVPQIAEWLTAHTKARHGAGRLRVAEASGSRRSCWRVARRFGLRHSARALGLTRPPGLPLPVLRPPAWRVRRAQPADGRHRGHRPGVRADRAQVVAGQPRGGTGDATPPRGEPLRDVRRGRTRRVGSDPGRGRGHPPGVRMRRDLDPAAQRACGNQDVWHLHVHVLARHVEDQLYQRRAQLRSRDLPASAASTRPISGHRPSFPSSPFRQAWRSMPACRVRHPLRPRPPATRS